MQSGDKTIYASKGAATDVATIHYHRPGGDYGDPASTDFNDFWEAQTPGYSPTTKIINAMTEGERRRLKRAVRAALPVGPNGRIEYAARAHAIRAAIP